MEDFLSKVKAEMRADLSRASGSDEDTNCQDTINLKNHELIRQGNVLIAAARDGKIGLSEDEIRLLQRFYVNRRTFRNLAIAIMVIGAAIFVVNLSQYINRPSIDASMYEGAEILAAFSGPGDGGPAERYMATAEQAGLGGIQNQHEMILGVILAMAGFIFLSFEKNGATKYVNLVSREYPKLQKKEAA